MSEAGEVQSEQNIATKEIDPEIKPDGFSFPRDRCREAFNEITHNEKVFGMQSSASDLEDEMELAYDLGLTDANEATYVRILCGKEMLVDQQTRRRGTSIPGYEVSDGHLRVLGGGLRKRDIKAEEAYLGFVDMLRDDIAASVGESRERMIRFGVHDIFSNALAEGREDEKSITNLRRNKPDLVVGRKDLAQKKAYWKEQIANPPAENT